MQKADPSSLIKNIKKHERHPHMTYSLIRSGLLSPVEFMLLGIIASYGHGCWLKVEEIGAMINFKDRKTRALIARLTGTGLLCKKYGAHRRMKLNLSGETFQEFWVHSIRDTTKKWDQEAFNAWELSAHTRAGE